MAHRFWSIVALLGCLFVGEAATAHAKLVAADPPVGGVVKTSPRKLALTFSEAISSKLSGAAIWTSGGTALSATASLANGGKTLSLMLGAPLQPGAYAVEWHAVASDDGHRTSGRYAFTVR